MGNEALSISNAADAIKAAVLKAQFEAVKEVNRIQLATYYGVGRYLSQHTRNAAWGKSSLKEISSQLQKMLPGLRGFSADSLKLMRLFYEGWQMLDGTSNQPANQPEGNSLIAINGNEPIEENIDTNSLIAINGIQDFPIEDFFRVPFTHHSRILGSVKTLEERYYC